MTDAPSPVTLLAAAIRAVTSERPPARGLEDPTAARFRSGLDLIGWAASHHPELLVHLSDEQLSDVARVLDGMLAERALGKRDEIVEEHARVVGVQTVVAAEPPAEDARTEARVRDQVPPVEHGTARVTEA